MEVLGRGRVGVSGSRDAVASGCEGFVDGGLDAGKLCGGHAGEVQQVGCAVCEGDVEVWGRDVLVVEAFESFSRDFILMWWVDEICYVDLISSNAYHEVRI